MDIGRITRPTKCRKTLTKLLARSEENYITTLVVYFTTLKLISIGFKIYYVDAL